MKSSVVIVTVVAIVIVLGSMYFVLGSKQSTTGNVVAGTAKTNTVESKVITLDASRFAYTPDVITVKKGQPVKIIINDKDTTHGIAIPDFGVKGIGSVEFTPDKTGTFEFHCPTFCGQGHREMTGTLIVKE